MPPSRHGVGPLLGTRSPKCVRPAAAFTPGKTITPGLLKVLEEVATTGKSRYEWALLKPLLAAKIEAVCNEYNEGCADVPGARPPHSHAPRLFACFAREQVGAAWNRAGPNGGESFESVLRRLVALLDEFSETPFTAQRLTELLLNPRHIYPTSTRKLMNALEKMLTVSSTIPVMVLAAAADGSYQQARARRTPRLRPQRGLCLADGRFRLIGGGARACKARHRRTRGRRCAEGRGGSPRDTPGPPPPPSRPPSPPSAHTRERWQWQY